MFTGIIQATAKVSATKKSGECLRVSIGKPKSWKFALGQSISVDGICSTVTAQSKDLFDVEYMPETIVKTTAGSFAEGALVNLERSLTLRDYIDGHVVQGHVDARGRIVSVVEEGSARRITIELPQELRRYVAVLGSLAVNGVSLTVARLSGDRATVALIPHTLVHTNLDSLKQGSEVNIEADVMARYILAALGKSGTRNATVPYAKKTLRKKG